MNIRRSGGPSFDIVVILALAGGLVGYNGTVVPSQAQAPAGSSGVARSVSSDASATRTASSALMYVSSGNTISIYAEAGQNQSPLGTITTGLNGPSGMYVDGSGDLYVSNAGLGNVVVFHKGQTSPYETLTGITEGNFRNDVTTDARGTVYAVQDRSKIVYVFAHGATTPTSQLTTLGAAAEVATDSQGDLFVEPSTGRIEEFAPGKTKPKKLSMSVYSAGGLAVDNAGNLVVCDGGGDDGFSGAISVFAPQYTGAPTLQTGLFNGIFGCAVNRVTGNVWAATHGNTAFAERFNLALKENDLIPRGSAFPGGIAVDSLR